MSKIVFETSYERIDASKIVLDTSKSGSDVTMKAFVSGFGAVAKRHRKLASYEVAGNRFKTKSVLMGRWNRPPSSVVPPGRIIFPTLFQPLRSWLISIAPVGASFQANCGTMNGARYSGLMNLFAASENSPVKFSFAASTVSIAPIVSGVFA